MNPKVTADIDQAVTALRAGGVIAYPTEGVWGLGCDPMNPAAVERVLALKGRPGEKGLILIAADAEAVRPLLADPDQLGATEGHWPGPVTFVFDAAGTVPASVGRPDGSVAVRVTGHPQAAELCRRFGGAVVSTSANPAGAPPAHSALAVEEYFDGQLDLLLMGETGGRSGPSTIRDARSGAVLRQG